MLTTKEWISWWYPVPSFDFCYPLLCKNNICCRKPALILYHTKHIMSVRVLTGSCWRKWAPLIRQKCVLFGFLESNCSLTLPRKKKYFCFHLHLIFFVYLCNQRHHGKSALSITFWLCLFFFLFLLPYYSRSFKSSNGVRSLFFSIHGVFSIFVRCC